jgi:hypothetical protein
MVHDTIAFNFYNYLIIFNILFCIENNNNERNRKKFKSL